VLILINLDSFSGCRKPLDETKEKNPKRPTAFKNGNNQEAYDYYSKILEIDIKNS